MQIQTPVKIYWSISRGLKIWLAIRENGRGPQFVTWAWPPASSICRASASTPGRTSSPRPPPRRGWVRPSPWPRTPRSRPPPRAGGGWHCRTAFRALICRWVFWRERTRVRGGVEEKGWGKMNEWRPFAAFLYRGISGMFEKKLSEVRKKRREKFGSVIERGA